MFRTDKKYDGATANSMVAHLVRTYKEQIRTQTLAIEKYKSKAEEFERDNERLREVIEHLDDGEYISLSKYEKLQDQLANANKHFKSVQIMLNDTKKELAEVKSEYRKKLKEVNDKNLSLSIETINLRNQIELLQSKLNSGKTSENPFEEKYTVSSYSISEDWEVRFDKCVMSNGDEYIDARKYYQGKPTRKGICLNLDDFDTFLRFGRTAWAKISSGIFNDARKQHKHFWRG